MKVSFTYPRDKFEEFGIDKRKILHLVHKHRAETFNRLQENYDYYNGEQAILLRERDHGAPNNRTVCNHAKNIADTASGYFMGNPITYQYDDSDKLNELIKAFDIARVDDVDQDNALNLSIYGVCHEYIFAKEGTNELSIKALDSRHTFMVTDESIEHRNLFAVYYDVERDDINEKEKYVAIVFDAENIYRFILYPTAEERSYMDGDPQPHNLGAIPIVEYKNNKFAIGDFEQQIGLIDAYNELMSDRVNDKEQFIDAVLVLYGSILGDTREETVEAMEELKRHKLLELPEGAKAEYLTRTLDENSVETLRRALKEDIYTLSQVPNLTDNNFSGNSSGVAMEYKLLGLEMLTRTKERYYRKGIRKRIKLFCNYYKALSGLEADSDAILPKFSRALPKNLVEISQVISMLEGSVSKQTLLQLLPFVEDPQNEQEKVVEEQKEKLTIAMGMQKQQQDYFANNPPTKESIEADGNNEPVEATQINE